MKKALVVIVFLLLVGGGGYWLISAKKPQQAQAPTPSIPADQGTNTNAQPDGQNVLPSQGIVPSAQQDAQQQNTLTQDSSVSIPTVVSTGPANSATPTQPATTPPQQPAADTNAKPALPPVEYVEIINHTFAPASVTIKQGGVVKWTNDDTDPHSIISDNGPFQGPTLRQTDSFTFTFDKPGTYTYHCGIHPSMHGVVIVTQ